MNTGQMMLTIAALVLLGMVVMRVNSGFLATGTTIMETKFNVMAISLGTSLIEEANTKAFDESTVSSDITTTTPLSAFNLLGPESGETYPNYDDFDDFNNYNRIIAAQSIGTTPSGVETVVVDTTFRSANFRIDCLVDYVTISGSQVVSTTTKTWNKRLRVTVTSPSMRDTVRLQTIFSYWYFR
ncbi:MAG: hypothetical protein N2321_01675 [Melioribacteraceae bacterium]|nr:hypothetical protein [Melioribacteraceae bacterium]